MYRIRSSGEVKSQGEIRKMYQNTSLPSSWNQEVCEDLGIDPILESPAPEATRYQTVVQSGVEQDSKGNWVWAWVVTDMDEEAIAYLDNQEADNVRKHRNKLLSDSDWTQVADAPVDKAAWSTYRQALRDITSQPGFPWDITWPIKP